MEIASPHFVIKSMTFLEPGAWKISKTCIKWGWFPERVMPQMIQKMDHHFKVLKFNPYT